MIVLMLERVTPSTRGELTRWMIELRPGVFVGSLSAMVRERLWEKAWRGDGVATMVYTVDTEQGYAIRSQGEPSRLLVDFEGLQRIELPRASTIKGASS